MGAALIHMAKEGDNEAMEFLLNLSSSGADVNAIDFPAARELGMPVNQAVDEFIARMRAAGLSPHTIKELFALHRFFTRDHCPKSEIVVRVHETLEDHPDLERDYYNFLPGFGPLHYAAQNGHASCVDLLLSRGARVDEERASRAPLGVFTPLFLASKNGQRAVVDELLAAGADTEVSDGLNPTALACAAMNGYRSIVLALFRAGATPSDISSPLPAHQIHHIVSFRTTQQISDSTELNHRVRKAGDFVSFARNHRRVLGGVVVRCAGRPFPLDAAEHVVEFMCPPGGH